MIKNVILDLDETIINSFPTEDFDAECDEHNEKLQIFKVHNMDDYYMVFERPYLQDFLDNLFEKYNVSVWTAATKLYALFIINNIILKKGRKLDFILFSSHCDYSNKHYKGGKDLQLLFDTLPQEYTKDNTIIIDDQNYVKEVQEKNCFQVKEFKAFEKNSHQDKELHKVLSFLNDEKL